MENVQRKYFAFKLCLFYDIITIFLQIYIQRTSLFYFIKDFRNWRKGNNL